MLRFQEMAISSSEAQSSMPTKPNPQLEIQSVKCHSCGFTEDCTLAYISRVRERYRGRWICGLCVEAVKDEVLRSDRLISTEEALNRHIDFCNRFRSTSETEYPYPISVTARILRKSLDIPRPLRTNSSGALPDVDKIKDSPLIRSESCFSALSG